MSQLREILDATLRAVRTGQTAVLATVVKTTGSAYRRPGARMLFPSTGPPVGFVSGGCLEADLAERAQEVLRSGDARTVVYDMRSPDDIVWGLGLGCNGEVRVLLDRLVPEAHPGSLEFLDACLRDRTVGLLATVFDSAGQRAPRLGEWLTLTVRGQVGGTLAESPWQPVLVGDASACLALGRSAVRRYTIEDSSAEVLLEVVAPSISLVIFGAGRDACPLVRFAAELGWRVIVVDGRAAYATTQRFPEADEVRLVDPSDLDCAGLPIDERTAAVVMTHHFLNDVVALRYLLGTAAPYIGLLGPRRRTENLLAELGDTPLPRAASQRVYGPVGLDIGAEAPEEIALAVLAEIRAVLAGRHGGFLRQRRGPLHDWP